MVKELISANPDEIGDFWARAIYPFLAPLAEADYRLQPSPIGSGVVIAFLGKPYLITANHVMAGHIDGSAKGAPYTYLPEQTEILGVIHSAPDPFDIALIELPNNAKRFLRMPQHLALELREGELCLFVGFQARSKSWEIDPNRNSLRPSPLSYLGRVSRPSTERFSIRFNQKQLQRGGGRRPPIGKLNGISGSGVFVLRDDAPKLAGIIIEYHAMRSEIVCSSAIVIWEMLKLSRQ
ncbi:MAG: hypothetical protein ACHP8B_12515 [Terriglobales bacterium]